MARSRKVAVTALPLARRLLEIDSRTVAAELLVDEVAQHLRGGILLATDDQGLPTGDPKVIRQTVQVIRGDRRLGEAVGFKRNPGPFGNARG